MDVTPSASVVVPTYERPGPLLACLDALARLDYPRERLEIIVVNDGGRLPETGVHDRSDLNLSIVNQLNAGPASARNAGAARATGDILAFTDDDCAPAPDWLSRLVEAVVDEPSSLAGGRTLNALPDDPFATASQLLVDFLYEYYGASGNGPGFFTSNNMAVEAGRFRALGGFDTGFPRAAGEDREFCDRWQHGGGRLQHVPAAVVLHAHHMSLGRFWRQHFAYGTGAHRFHGARARRNQDRVRVEPPGFYGRLVTYPLRRVGGVRAVPLVGLMLLSQVANVAGYAAERRRTGRTATR